MNVLEATVKLVDVLAWPVVSIVIALLFRKSLAGIFQGRRLDTLQAGPLSATLSAEIDTLKETVDQSTRQTAIDWMDDSDGAEPGGSHDPYRTFRLAEANQVASTSPNAAIITATDVLINQLSELNSQSDGRAHSYDINDIIDNLVERNRIDARTAESLHGAVRIRNRVIESPQTHVSSETAQGYISLISTLLNRITT
ncbi:hypothetical protein [Haloglycomyces albus]|uniref:hypothetical protein n=1 Tax=Haloglycomyces albus TaxID=526067 RepID=UPI00046CAB68|nr:hypothetical protein [Haloglycomyces albus]